MGRAGDRGRQPDTATKNLGQNRGRIFISTDRKKIILWKPRGNCVIDNVAIVQKYFPQTHVKKPLLFYYSIYQDNFLKNKQNKTVNLANNVSLSPLLVNLFANNRCYLLYVKQLD